MQTILENINSLKRCMQYAPKERQPAIPQIEQGDAGCIKLDEDFAVRAADLILGAEANQMQALCAAMSDLCTEIFQNSGDKAYQRAASYLLHASVSVGRRRSN